MISGSAVRCGLFFLTLVVMGAARAEEAPREDVIAELSAAYAKQGGYIATYRSVGEGKSLECTLGADMATGAGVTHVVAVKGDQKMEGKFWSTPDDKVFTDGNGRLLVVKGLNEQFGSLTSLIETLTDPAEKSAGKFLQNTPGMLLEKSTMAPTMGLRTQLQAPWIAEVEDCPIQTSDEKSVIFLSEKLGLLTISRENGMLLKQSLVGENGEERVLELKDLKPNPGKEAIAAISADWSTTGAEEIPAVASMAPIRLALFQLIIDAAEQGKVDHDKLEQRLEEQYEALRHFAQACIDLKTGPFASKADWASLMGKLKITARDEWREKNPNLDAIAEADFTEYLRKPEVRLKLRNLVVEALLTEEQLPEIAMDDIFGRGGWAALKVGNDQGIAAKKSLVTALSRAYLEALIDLKMIKQWDQRDGLD